MNVFETGFSYEIVRVMSRWGYIRYLYLDRAEAVEAEVADTRWWVSDELTHHH